VYSQQYIDMPLTYQGMLFGLLVAQGLLVTVNVPVMTLQFYAYTGARLAAGLISFEEVGPRPRWDTWARGNCGHRYLAHQGQDAACHGVHAVKGQCPVCLELLVPVSCVRHFHWTCSILIDMGNNK
jgi:hypothetical protein